MSADEMEPVVRRVLERFKPAIDPHCYAPLDANSIVALWRTLLANSAGIAYGLFDNEQGVGFLLGVVSNDDFTGKLHGSEWLWVSEPGRADSVKLLRAFEHDCRKLQCTTVQTGCYEGWRPEHMTKLYSALGYAPHTRAFVKIL